MPAVLQKLMRHANINTTMKYYVNVEADEIAAELWKGFQGQESTILGTIGQDEPKKPSEVPAEGSTETPCGDSSYDSGGQGIRTLNGLRRT